jgi:hypothetical protein
MEWELEPSADVLRVRPLRALLRPIREREFVYEEYEAFLDQLAATDCFRVVPLREFATAPRDRVLVGLRHDVDERLDAALEFARLEHERGLRTTYFLLHTAPYYAGPDLLAAALKIQNLYGHEIGLHHDLLTVLAEGGDPAKCLAEELARLRSGGLDVHGTAAHGSRWSHVLGASGEYLFAGHGPSAPHFVNRDEVEIRGRRVPLPKLELARFNLTYEANRLPFDRMDHDAQFAADGRRWHTSDAKLEALTPGVAVIFLIHPCHWDRSIAAKVARTLLHGVRRLVSLTHA